MLAAVESIHATSAGANATQRRTFAGLLPSVYDPIAAPVRSPHVLSCSNAAALNVSPEPSITFAPSDANLCDSLPIVVVLPPPLTPTMSITAGLPTEASGRFSAESPPRVCSVLTMLVRSALRRSSLVFNLPACQNVRYDAA